MSRTPKHIKLGSGLITKQLVSCGVIYGFVIRIYCKCHWLLQNASLKFDLFHCVSYQYSSWIPVPFSYNCRDTQNHSKTILSLKARPFLGFLYWILPFLLLVSSHLAFQPPSSWTCSSFPWNLKSGLNIFAPADVPLGLSLLWFQRNWVQYPGIIGCLPL